ncbi:putative toxin-antitoxin system toxin component, PIN family [Candidatus Margulisiibacteriota bacterium]
MVKKKVILDTNIIISALGYNGKERTILEKCVKNELQLYLSEETLKELERVLEYPKFKFSQEQKDNIKLIISKFGHIVTQEFRVNVVVSDPSDNKFLEAAISANAEYLITGDKALLQVKQFGRTKILNAARFLKEIN